VIVAIAGAHGKVARQLARLLVARGDEVRGLIRNPEHADDLRADGSEPVGCDLEAAGTEEVAEAIAGADAAVFAAGAGPGSGPARKQTVDLGAAVKLIDAAQRLGIDRYVIVSAIGASDPGSAAPEMRPYYDAKAEADSELARSGLAFTVVRPGRLTNDPGTGRIRAGLDIGSGSVTRDDVAATLAAVLAAPNTIGVTFDLLEGDVPIQDAVTAL
jgi:nucleoside-diphosphate-sugar epimerase